MARWWPCWAGGKYAAAIQLEQFWDRFAAHVPLSLLCGYPMASFHGANDPDLHLLSDLHSHARYAGKIAA